jgi:hypothetical protein
MSVSEDAGATWSPPRLMFERNNGFDGPRPIVVGNRLLAFWRESAPTGQPGQPAEPTRLFASVSTDRGRTWKDTVITNALDASEPMPLYDQSRKRFYAVWHDNGERGLDVYFASSRDGVRWTAPSWPGRTRATATPRARRRTSTPVASPLGSRRTGGSRRSRQDSSHPARARHRHVCGRGGRPSPERHARRAGAAGVLPTARQLKCAGKAVHTTPSKPNAYADELTEHTPDRLQRGRNGAGPRQVRLGWDHLRRPGATWRHPVAYRTHVRYG